jgi:anti-sigma B factor antagonist
MEHTIEIVKTRNGDMVTLEINGKLNAATSEEFAAAIEAAIAETDKLTLDFRGVTYLASAGLRVLVSAQKRLVSQSGSFTLINVGETIREVFEVTGLDGVLGVK